MLKKFLFVFLSLFIPLLAFADVPIQVESLIAGLTNSSGQPLAGGKIYTYSCGTTSNKTTWQDSGKVTPHANPIILDAEGKKLVFADGCYKFRIDNSADVTQYTHDNLLFSNYMGPESFGGASTGSANAYVVTLSPALLAYDSGTVVSYLANFSNTGAATVNVNGLGAKSIVNLNNQALVANDIVNGALVSLQYDGTSFRILNPSRLPKVSMTVDGTNVTTVSGSFATMTGATATVTVTSGDYVRITYTADMSVDNIGTALEFRISENGAAATPAYTFLYTSNGDVSTNGSLDSHSNTLILTTPVTGSVTYALQWRRAVGANTGYSDTRSFSVEVIRP